MQVSKIVKPKETPTLGYHILRIKVKPRPECTAPGNASQNRVQSATELAEDQPSIHQNILTLLGIKSNHNIVVLLSIV